MTIRHITIVVLLVLTGVARAQEDPYTQALTYKFGDSRQALMKVEAEIRSAKLDERAGIEAKLLAALNNPATVYGVVTFSDNTTLDFSKAATVPFTTPPSYLGFIVNTPGVTILKISTNLPTQNGFAFSEVSLGTAVPEPASLMLLVTGLVGLSWRKRR